MLSDEHKNRNIVHGLNLLYLALQEKNSDIDPIQEGYDLKRIVRQRMDIVHRQIMQYNDHLLEGAPLPSLSEITTQELHNKVDALRLLKTRATDCISRSSDQVVRKWFQDQLTMIADQINTLSKELDKTYHRHGSGS